MPGAAFFEVGGHAQVLEKGLDVPPVLAHGLFAAELLGAFFRGGQRKKADTAAAEKRLGRVLLILGAIGVLRSQSRKRAGVSATNSQQGASQPTNSNRYQRAVRYSASVAGSSSRSSIWAMKPSAAFDSGPASRCCRISADA